MEGEQENVENLDMLYVHFFHSNPPSFAFDAFVWFPPQTAPFLVALWVKKTADVRETHFDGPHPLEAWKISNCRMLLWVFQRSMQPFLDSWMQIEHNSRPQILL